GSFHTGYWQEIAVELFGALGCIGFAGGALVCVFGRPHISAVKRVLLIGVVVLGMVAAALIQLPFTPPHRAARLDMTPKVAQGVRFPYDPRFPGSGVPNGLEATQELAKRVNLPVSLRFPARDVLIFDNGIRISRQRVVSDDGLPTDNIARGKV